MDDAFAQAEALAAAESRATAGSPAAAGSFPSTGRPGGSSGIPRDVLLTIGRVELDRLGDALRGLLGPDIHRPDTPARLEAALAAAVEALGGTGRPRVTRRPAGLTTPEAWLVHLTDVEPHVTDVIRGALRSGRFAP